MKPLNQITTLLVYSSLLWACSKTEPPPEPPKPALVMAFGDSIQSQQNVTFQGEVKSRYTTNLGFRVAGKISQRLVNTGDHVKKGQILATLDTNDASLNSLAANASVQSAQANVDLAKVELERQQQLYTQKFISKSAVDVKEANYKTALAALQQARAQSNLSSNQAAYTRLVADKEGVISSITAEPGQVVAAGQTVAQILDNATLEVLIAVPESSIKAFSVGQSTPIHLWSDSAHAYQGQVREISPEANPQTRAFDVRVKFLNLDDSVKLGMTAMVSLGQRQLIKQLPSSAVSQSHQQAFVWSVDTHNTVHKQAIKIGPFNESGIEVASGLNIGQRVVIAGVQSLAEGQQVRPISPESLK